MKNPEIRFIDDNIDWQTKKLKNITTISKGEQLNKTDMIENGNYYVLNGGSSPSGKTNAFNTLENTISISEGGNSCGFVNFNTEKYWSGGHNYTLNNIKDNVSFIYQILKANQNKIMSLRVGSGIPNIQRFNLEDFEIGIIPDKNIQSKIASIFNDIDQKISSQEILVQKLKDTKSALLIKMFPQENQSAPELRFNGFTNDWEQRKLSDISKKISEKNTKGEISETFTNSAEYGVISQRDFFDRNITNAENINTYYIVRNEDFVYNPRISTSAPCGPINRNKLNRAGVMSPLYTVFRTKNIDTLYLEWFFKTPHWYPYMYLNGDTGARSDRFSIKDETFFNMPIPFPNNEEQKRIGTLLETLDNLITLHQRKLDKLKEVKSALLDKLLV